MTPEEFKEAFLNLFKETEIDESEAQELESTNNGEESEAPEAQGESPEDTQGEMWQELLTAFSESHKKSEARIEKLEKQLAQALTKAPAVEAEEDMTQAMEDYTPLLDMDFTTPAPKM